MNAVSRSPTPPLGDILGARWQTGARASAIAWDARAKLVAFGLSDGSLAVAGSSWAGAPTVRPRAGGGAELVPATAPAPPVARIPVHDGACLALAADPESGFLSTGVDGQLARVQIDGVIDTLATLPRDLVAAPVATGPGSWRAVAAGHTAIRLGVQSRKIELPAEIAALAVAPDGSRVAIAHAAGLAVWAGGNAPRALRSGGDFATLAWSADSRRLASGTTEGDVFVTDLASGETRGIDQGRSMKRSLAFTADGARLVTSASGGVAAWTLETGALEMCGAASRHAVLHVACHPHRDLIAAGYANGVVLICRPGNTEILFVRAAAGSAVDALAWSPDGETLAAAAGGEIAITVLPDQLFRDQGHGVS